MKDAKRTRIAKADTGAGRCPKDDGAGGPLATTLAAAHPLARVRPGALGGRGVWFRGGRAACGTALARAARSGVHWASMHCAALMPAVMLAV